MVMLSDMVGNEKLDFPLDNKVYSDEERMRRIALMNLDIGEHLETIHQLALFAQPDHIVDLGVGHGLGSSFALAYACHKLKGTKMTSIDITLDHAILDFGFDFSWDVIGKKLGSIYRSLTK